MTKHGDTSDSRFPIDLSIGKTCAGGRLRICLGFVNFMFSGRRELIEIRIYKGIVHHSLTECQFVAL